MPEKPPAWVLYAGLRAGADHRTLFRELVSVLLRRDMSADSGLLCHAKTVEECKIVVSASWMDFIHGAYRHNSVKGEFSGASLLTIRHERWVVIVHPEGPSTGGQWPQTMRHERWVVIVHPLGPRQVLPGNVVKGNLANKAFPSGEGGRAPARSEEANTISPNCFCMSKVVPLSSAPFGGTFPKGEGFAPLKHNLVEQSRYAHNLFPTPSFCILHFPQQSYSCPLPNTMYHTQWDKE